MSPRRTRRSAASAPASASRESDRQVLGVVKAYTTRVGEGPFPTELSGEMGNRLRESGSEYGAVTGRPRRCGWFDAVAVRYAARINGLDGLALTKLDVLDGLEEISICTSYRCGDKTLTDFPSDVRQLARASRSTKRCPAGRRRPPACATFDRLPEDRTQIHRAARGSIRRPFCDRLTGSERNDTILREDVMRIAEFGLKI
jgi:adenylosuccinate synthase